MKLGRINPFEQYHMKEPVGANALSEVNTGSPIFVTREQDNGNEEAIYNVNIIYLLDKLFLGNSFNVVSIDQERFFKRFFKEADKVNKKLENQDKEPFKDISPIMKQLDNFLGSYMGENNGRFIREGQPAFTVTQQIRKF